MDVDVFVLVEDVVFVDVLFDDILVVDVLLILVSGGVYEVVIGKIDFDDELVWFLVELDVVVV